MEDSTIITEVQEMLHSKTGVPPNRQELIFAGKHLGGFSSSRMLRDFNIQKESTLHLIIRNERSGAMGPEETTFPAKTGVDTVISSWEAKAKAGDFDDDLYIVDPQAYYSKLQYLEKDVVETSEFFRIKGKYEPSNNQGVDLAVRRRIRSIPAWAWTLNELLISSPSQSSRDTNETHWQDVQNTLASLWKSYLIICRILENCGSMQKAGFCRDSFNIMVEHPEKDLAEIVRISISDVDDIKGGLEAAIPRILEQSELKSIESYLIDFIAAPCEKMLRGLGFPHDTSSLTSKLSISMTCRMLALVLDLALVSYVGSHGCRFDLEYIDQECQDIKVQSPLEEVFSFDFHLRQLACLKGFLDNRMIWTLQIYKQDHQQYGAERRTVTKPLSILTRMSDFADIWGPISTVRVREGATDKIKQYNVSKGVICRVKEEPLPYRNAIICHWFSYPSYYRRRLSSIVSRPKDLYLSDDDLLYIGTIDRENLDCTYTLDDFESDYENRLGVLGTRPAEWKLDTLGAAVGFSKIFGISLSGTKKRIPETPLKQLIYDRWTARPDSFRANPAVLNQFLAVEVSHCTGNARRVSMKDLLLMECLEPLLERQIPGWRKSRWGKEFNVALQVSDSEAIFNFWDKFKTERKYVAELLCSILEALDTTGCRDDTFVTGFFNRGQESSVQLSLKENDWACFLKDSPLMAVYAVMNRVCIECQTPNHSTMTHANSDSYTVLKTQIALENGTDFKRIKLNPHGHTFKKVDGGRSDITILVPESGLEKTLFFTTTLNHSLVTAVELRNRRPIMNIPQRRSQPRADVYFCASNKSHGGMNTPRTHTLANDSFLTADSVSVISDRTSDLTSSKAVPPTRKADRLWDETRSNPDLYKRARKDEDSTLQPIHNPRGTKAWPPTPLDKEILLANGNRESGSDFTSSESSSIAASEPYNQQYENRQHPGERATASSAASYGPSPTNHVPEPTPHSTTLGILDDPREYGMYAYDDMEIDEDMEIACFASMESAQATPAAPTPVEGLSLDGAASERYGPSRLRRQPKFLRDGNGLAPE